MRTLTVSSTGYRMIVRSGTVYQSAQICIENADCTPRMLWNLWNRRESDLFRNCNVLVDLRREAKRHGFSQSEIYRAFSQIDLCLGIVR